MTTTAPLVPGTAVRVIRGIYRGEVGTLDRAQENPIHPMTRTRVAIATAIASLAIAAPAHADDFTAGDLHVTGQRAWTGPLADRLYAAADAYWTRLGHPGPRPTLMLADGIVDGGVAAQGVQFDSTVWVLAWNVGNAELALSLDPRQTDTTTTPRYLCRLLAHELGHARGLDHNADPASAMDVSSGAQLPECVAAFPSTVARFTAAAPTPSAARSYRRQRARARAARRHALRAVRRERAAARHHHR